MMASETLRRHVKGYGFVLPWLIALTVFIGMPFIAGFYFSLCDYPGLESPVFVGLDNYKEMLGDKLFWKSMGVTITYGAVAIPCGVVLAMTLAMFLNARIRGQTFYRVVFYIPFLVPTVVVAVLWMWIFNPDYGLLNIVINQIFRGINWCVGLLFSLPKADSQDKYSVLSVILPVFALLAWFFAHKVSTGRKEIAACGNKKLLYALAAPGFYLFVAGCAYQVLKVVLLPILGIITWRAALTELPYALVAPAATLLVIGVVVKFGWWDGLKACGWISLLVAALVGVAVSAGLFFFGENLVQQVKDNPGIIVWTLLLPAAAILMQRLWGQVGRSRQGGLNHSAGSFLFILSAIVLVVGAATLVYVALHQWLPVDMKKLQSPGWLSDGSTMPSLVPNSPPWALWALIVMSMWGVGQMAVIYLAKLQDVPGELYEAAEIDGATWIQKTWHVTIPQITPIILFNVTMAIIGEFQVFAEPYIMTQGGPEDKTRFIAMFIYEQVFNYQRMGYGSAAAFILFLVIVALTVFAYKVLQKRIYYAAK
jgi:ABC-type sugar transport system permease subunit